MHYDVYKTRCEAGKIAMNDWVIPRPIWKEMVRKKMRTGSVVQSKLDGQFKQISAPKVFTWDSVVDAVARHIVCDDQVGE
jgi:hypothetical protein